MFKNKNFFSIILLFIQINTSLMFICTPENCPENNGECIENLCLCSAGFTTFYIDNKKIEKLCNYALKSKTWAISFEMLFPFGIGHFYVKRYMHGLAKFILFWFLSILKIFYKKRIKGYPDLNKVSRFLTWVFFLLYAIDYFGFSFNFYSDGNGLSLI